jgi:hypothetical protein
MGRGRDREMQCHRIGSVAFRRTMLSLADLSLAAVLATTCPSCFLWPGETVEEGRSGLITYSYIPIAAGNTTSWDADVAVSPVVRVYGCGAGIRAVLNVEREQIPYRIAKVDSMEASGRLALLSAGDLSAIRWAMDQLVAYGGPRSDSARNIPEVKARIERALQRLAEGGAAVSLRKALMGQEMAGHSLILRLEDEPASVRFAIMLKGDHVLAGANQVSAEYYARPDMQDGHNRPGILSDPAIDLLYDVRGSEPWTSILYSLARPAEELPDVAREAMETWCREPIGVRKTSQDDK